MRKELEEGNVIPIDDRFVYRTMVVYTGIDINEISNINPRNETFTADFYLWFRHKGYLDYSKIEFLNAVQDLRLRDEPIMEMTGPNLAYRAYRIKSDFNAAFIFRDYPFDSQTLSMLFVSPEGPPFVARMSLGVIALLTAVFLRLEAAGQLPNIGYLVALDYMYFAVYVLILSGIVITVTKHRALRRGKGIRAKRLDYFGRVFQPIYTLIGIGIFVYLY